MSTVSLIIPMFVDSMSVYFITHTAVIKRVLCAEGNDVHRVSEVHNRPERQVEKLPGEVEEHICTSEIRNQI
jgi:hypothetical protein